MEFQNKLNQAITKMTEWLQEQAWFQQLKAKWDELDPQMKFYGKLGFMGVGALFVLGAFGFFVSSVYRVRSDYSEKLELVRFMQSANEELDKLKKFTGGPAASGYTSSAPWSAHIETVAATIGIDKTVFSLTNEKALEKVGDMKETTFDVALKHITIRQLVRFAFALESGSRPIKLRNLIVDTKNDPSGYLDVTYSLSGFASTATK